MANTGMRNLSVILSKVSLGATLVAAALLSGCIDNTTVVDVRKDGSGFVSEVTYVSPAMDQMMNQMMQGMMSAMTNAGSDGAVKAEVKISKPDNSQLLDRKQYEEKAKLMGEGVTVVNVAEMKRKDGATGVRVDYAFKDISKLKLETGSPKEPTNGSGNGMGMEKPVKKSKPMTFAFTPGSPAKLTIMMPPDEKPDPSETSMPDNMAGSNFVAHGGEGQAAPDQKDPAMENMMKTMLKDFHLKLNIKVDGEILKSNASHVQIGATSHKKQYVTLFDVEFGKILTDPKLFEKYADQLSELGMIGGDSPEAKKILTGIPGIQFEPEKKVEIEFQ